MKLLLFPGSLRKASWNRKFVLEAERLLKTLPNVDTKVLEIAELDFPVYNADIEAKAIPDKVKKLSDLIKDHDGVVISTPEYNGSIPGNVKNMADWTSRIEPHSWKGKPLLLIGASPGALGAVRSLWHTRVPFEVLGAYVYPDMLGLPKADQAFDDSGKLKDETMIKKLSGLLKNYTGFVKKLTS